MYVKVEGKTVSIRLPKWFVVTVWTTILAGSGHVFKTYIDMSVLQQREADCERQLIEVKKSIKALAPEMPGNEPTDGAGAPRR